MNKIWPTMSVRKRVMQIKIPSTSSNAFADILKSDRRNRTRKEKWHGSMEGQQAKEKGREPHPTGWDLPFTTKVQRASTEAKRDGSLRTKAKAKGNMTKAKLRARTRARAGPKVTGPKANKRAVTKAKAHGAKSPTASMADKASRARKDGTITPPRAKRDGVTDHPKANGSLRAGMTNPAKAKDGNRRIMAKQARVKETGAQANGAKVIGEKATSPKEAGNMKVQQSGLQQAKTVDEVKAKVTSKVSSGGLVALPLAQAPTTKQHPHRCQAFPYRRDNNARGKMASVFIFKMVHAISMVASVCICMLIALKINIRS